MPGDAAPLSRRRELMCNERVSEVWIRPRRKSSKPLPYTPNAGPEGGLRDPRAPGDAAPVSRRSQSRAFPPEYRHTYYIYTCHINQSTILLNLLAHHLSTMPLVPKENVWRRVSPMLAYACFCLLVGDVLFGYDTASFGGILANPVSSTGFSIVQAARLKPLLGLH